MKQQIQQSLRESKTARWTALAIVSFMMLCGYYMTDAMAPMKSLIEDNLGWSSYEYGLFTGAYSFANVFLFMLIFGGIILDKMGIRFSGAAAAVVMVIGASIKYLAITTVEAGTEVDLFFITMNAQVFYASLGFSIFGIGVEVAGITVSKTIVKWFKGKELALAMGLEMACARLGTALALSVSVPLATKFNENIGAPILFGTVLLIAGLIAFFIYMTMDKKLDASEENQGEEASEEDQFKISDIGIILGNKGFWLIALLCVLFYSAVFPFLKYATQLMEQKYGVDAEFAGLIPALLPFGNILLTPVFGSIYDRKGKGATIMIIGAVMLIAIHGLFSIPALDHYIVAVILILLLGVAFSLVPSAMWPSVPKIIPERQLGTAYAMIFYIQNIGLMLVPMLIGWELDKYGIIGVDEAGKNIYDYTVPMMTFTAFGVLALFIGVLLKADDKKNGYGLELPTSAMLDKEEEKEQSAA